MTFYIRLAKPIEAPAEATHFLVLKLAALPGANWDGLESALPSVVSQAFAKVINFFGSAIGWQLVGTPTLAKPGQTTPVGKVPDGQAWVFVYLKKTGSPISPLAALAIFIVVGLAVYGFVLISWALYETATAQRIAAQTEQQALSDMKELYEQGAITPEEYADYLKKRQQYTQQRTIFDSIASLLGITPEEARMLVIGIAVFFVFVLIVSLLK